MEGSKLTIRLIGMALLVVTLVFLMGGRLIGMQFINAETYTQTSERTSSSTITMPAARGEIYDRYGRSLVTNRLSYNITIDRASLFADGKAPDTAILLIRAAEACGVSYTDSLLPVSLPPFAYNEMTSEQEKYLKFYTSKKGWPEDLTAPELMDLLFDEYGMTSELKGAEGLLLSVYEARLVAGVLYEVDLRYQSETYPPPYTYVPAYVFASDVPMEMVSRVEENKYPGVDVAPVTARQYNTTAAAHLLGRVGPIQDDVQTYLDMGYASDELVGVDGSERAFESWLHGVSGERRVETDKEGRVINVTDISAPQAGQNIYLTIDIRLQEKLERVLAEGVAYLAANGITLKGLEAEAAAAVIIDVNSGEVLAAANYPTYNPKTFLQDFEELNSDPLNPLFNRAVRGTYAPGSTFKMVTAAAALENEIINTNTKIYDKGIYTYYLSPQPKCHIYPGTHYSVSVSEALKVSCNYFFYDVGRQTGIDQIVNWSMRFGLGLPTGFELEGNRETLGVVAGPESSEALGDTWYPGNTLSAAIGQHNNQFTLMQMANYTASIANGGTLYTAHLLKEVLSFDYSHEYYVSQPTPIRELGISDKNMKAIQEGMLMVTQSGGTAYGVFKDYPVAVAGKTGSVQVGSSPNNGVFVCYAPYDNPQIAVALAVEKGGAGSTIAPIARDILDIWFQLQEDMRSNPQENSIQR